jgi:glutamine amidotransferase
MRLTIFDYGAGNLHSLQTALAVPGIDITVESDPARCIDTDLLLLPGVGAFSQAAERLAPARDRVRDAVLGGLPTIGVCLGMQLFFDASEEGPGAGLGLIPGDVTRLHAARVPHIGWNTIDGDDPLLAESGLTTGYFANGFACRPDDETIVTAWTTHEQDRFPSMVRVKQAIGVQFHPEKSSTPGVRLIRAAVETLRR